jgi:hypothetical protein
VLDLSWRHNRNSRGQARVLAAGLDNRSLAIEDLGSASARQGTAGRPRGTESDIDAGFDRLVHEKVGAISVEADPYLLARRDQIVARAKRHSLPAIYPHREYVEAGGLASYGSTDLSMRIVRSASTPPVS